MLKRTVSGAILSLIMIGVFVFSHVPFVMNAFVAVISAMAVYEVLVVTKYIEGRFLQVFSFILALLIPFAQYLPNFTDNIPFLAFFLLTVLMFLLLILNYKTFRLEHLCFIFVMSLIIPTFLSTIIYTRQMEFGLYLTIFIFLTSWGSDVGGYLFGKFFGTAKFTPTISPKKTIEGVFGSFFASITAALCLCAVVDIFYDNVSVNYILVIICAALVSLFSILGDLSASIIKRNFGVKDFGNIIPGHGGIMDRFDSVLFAAPLVYLFMTIAPVFTVINI